MQPPDVDGGDMRTPWWGSGPHNVLHLGGIRVRLGQVERNVVTDIRLSCRSERKTRITSNPWERAEDSTLECNVRCDEDLRA